NHSISHPDWLERTKGVRDLLGGVNRRVAVDQNLRISSSDDLGQTSVVFLAPSLAEILHRRRGVSLLVDQIEQAKRLKRPCDDAARTSDLLDDLGRDRRRPRPFAPGVNDANDGRSRSVWGGSTRCDWHSRPFVAEPGIYPTGVRARTLDRKEGTQ